MCRKFTNLYKSQLDIPTFRCIYTLWDRHSERARIASMLVNCQCVATAQIARNVCNNIYSRHRWRVLSITWCVNWLLILWIISSLSCWFWMYFLSVGVKTCWLFTWKNRDTKGQTNMVFIKSVATLNVQLCEWRFSTSAFICLPGPHSCVAKL